MLSKTAPAETVAAPSSTSAVAVERPSTRYVQTCFQNLS
jgi:hypothetical protein